MGLYEQLLKRKLNGEELKLEELRMEDLKRLFIDELKTDKLIANIFEVPPAKITYLRRKYGITIRNSIVEKVVEMESDFSKEINDKIKQSILTDANINRIAKALTHFIFRNGPIEDMHSDVSKNITDEDMSVLNKFMVNRIAYIFTLIKDEQWLEFNYLIELMDMYGNDWDEAVVDDGGIRELFHQLLNNYRN